jgi:AcrR family transcriptional regulator
MSSRTGREYWDGARQRRRTERGVRKAIAERADVSVATVYNHFPSLDALVPARGELLQRITNPPSLDRAPELFRGIDSLEERLSRLIKEFFDFYERGETYLEVDARERRMPLVREWEAHMRSTREGFVREALRPVEPHESTVRAVSALLDFPVFKSFCRQDLSRPFAEEFTQALPSRSPCRHQRRASGCE